MSKQKDSQALKEWRKKVALIREKTHLESYGTPEEKRARIERAKKDYKYFVEYYLPSYATVDTPEFHVKAANRIKRNSEISMWAKWGRGLAKSVVFDVTVPLWLWINDDIKFMLVIGQEQDKAALLLDDIRSQFEGNERLIHDFGEQKSVGQWEKGFFITQNGFIGKSIGMGQEPRGLRVGAYRPDYIVCDDWETKDTLKNPKRQDEYANWLVSSIIPTMDGERERIILAQNQFAPRMIFTKIVEENKGWKVMRQNAFDQRTGEPVWDAKYDKKYYFKKILKMGLLQAKAEYNNDPHVEGKIFLDSHIQWAKLPRLDSFRAIVGQWDVAFAGSKTSDYNAVRVWGLKDGNKYLIDCFVKRSDVRAPLEWIAEYQKNLPKSVSVKFRFEAQFWNKEIYRVIDEVEEQYDITLNLTKSERSRKKKYDRILEMHPHYQNGRVFYNEKLKDHNDTKEGLAQLKGIEPGYRSHDDAPDADKDAFDYLDQFKPRKSRQRPIIHNRKSQQF